MNISKNFLVGVIVVLVLILVIKLIVPAAPFQNKINPEELDNELSTRSQAFKDYSNSVKDALKTTSGPISIFDPTINTNEREGIKTKVLDPYSAFHAPKGTKYFLVNKMTDSDRNKSGASASYEITAINYDGSTEEWLEGHVGTPLDYWIPSCLGDCKFTPSFQKDYPEVVKRYKEVALDQK